MTHTIAPRRKCCCAIPECRCRACKDDRQARRWQAERARLEMVFATVGDGRERRVEHVGC
jgi:hypothetical protein